MSRSTFFRSSLAFAFALMMVMTDPISKAVAATLTTSPSPSPTIPHKFLGMDVHGDPVLLPLIGTGTWQYNHTTAYQSVCQAFAAGYTFVDTALGYKNQRGVGKAIRDCWQGERSDLFVMTKIPGTYGHNDTVVILVYGCKLGSLC